MPNPDSSRLSRPIELRPGSGRAPRGARRRSSGRGCSRRPRSPGPARRLRVMTSDGNGTSEIGRIQPTRCPSSRSVRHTDRMNFAGVPNDTTTTSASSTSARLDHRLDRPHDGVLLVGATGVELGEVVADVVAALACRRAATRPSPAGAAATCRRAPSPWRAPARSRSGPRRPTGTCARGSSRRTRSPGGGGCRRGGTRAARAATASGTSTGASTSGCQSPWPMPRVTWK